MIRKRYISWYKENSHRKASLFWFLRIQALFFGFFISNFIRIPNTTGDSGFKLLKFMVRLMQYSCAIRSAQVPFIESIPFTKHAITQSMSSSVKNIPAKSNFICYCNLRFDSRTLGPPWTMKNPYEEFRIEEISNALPHRLLVVEELNEFQCCFHHFALPNFYIHSSSEPKLKGKHTAYHSLEMWEILYPHRGMNSDHKDLRCSNTTGPLGSGNPFQPHLRRTTWRFEECCCDDGARESKYVGYYVLSRLEHKLVLRCRQREFRSKTCKVGSWTSSKIICIGF